jgi:V8-like Glu-specific endopeptidase
MVDLPGPLYNSMRETLKRCPEFQNDTRLQAVFANELIAPWQDDIKEAQDRNERADLVIECLRGEKRTETQMNALWLLLCVLRDRTRPSIARHKELDDLARDFANILRSTTAPDMPPSSSQEANPYNLPMILTKDIKELLKRVSAVGKVSVPQYINGKATGQLFGGTGWLIAPDLVLTCSHVIEARTKMQRMMQKRITETDLTAQAERSTLAFDYTTTTGGIVYRVKKLECHDSTLDYALLRLEDSRSHPLSRWGWLKLFIDAVPKQGDSAYVIQHPKGEPQQTSLGRYINKDDKPSTQGQQLYIFHSAPTEEGTSGAPVFDTDSWSVAALHTSEEDTEHVRQATLLSAILSDIKGKDKEKKQDFYSIIMEAMKGK